MEALEARYPQLASRNSSEVERRAVDRPTLTLNGVLGLGRWRRALNNVKHEGNRTGDHGHGNYLFHGRLRWRSSESGSHVSVGATTPRPGGGVSDFRALIMEILLTSGPVSTILGTG
jgi:hypothetical protein